MARISASGVSAFRFAPLVIPGFVRDSTPNSRRQANGFGRSVHTAVQSWPENPSSN